MKYLTKRISTTLLLVLVIGLLSIGVSVHAQTASPSGITLNYANWNLGTPEENNLQRQLVAAYVTAHPDVTVNFTDMSGDGQWDDKLTNLAARGALPDVFMANNTPLYVQNGWVADLTSMVANDPDWATVPQVMRDAVTYSGHVDGLPAALFVLGYFVNHDLFDAANLTAPTYGTSVADFFTATSALTNVQQGVLGLDEIGSIEGWYPSTQDSTLGWFSFDGTHMNYNSAAFKAAVDVLIQHLGDTWQGLTDAQKTAFTSQGPWELFLNQESGVRWDGGWTVPDVSQHATFNWDFLGIPGGNQAIDGDILVVSSSSPNVQAAYDFARWMSFSSEGYAMEAQLAQAAGNNTVPTRMPVSITPASIDLYMSFVGDRPGLRQALGNLDHSLLESLAKIVPGYIDARWNGTPGIDIGDQQNVNLGWIFDNVATGAFQYTDYSARLETFANNILDQAQAQLPH